MNSFVLFIKTASITENFLIIKTPNNNEFKSLLSFNNSIILFTISLVVINFI